MEQTIEDVKEHFKKHKINYAIGISCLGLGIFVGVKINSSSTKIVNNIMPVFNNTANINFGGYSHKIVQCLNTDEIWLTVKSAAQAAGVETSRMSRHLNGHIPHINGKQYAIVGVGTLG
ncbi:MAG: hypothetical protein ABWY25_06095 [Paenisporosarcina sp.]